MDNPQPTNAQILEAVNKLGQRFDGLENRFDGLEKDNADILETINEFATKTEQRFVGIEQRLDSMESRMATKDDVSRIVGSLRGDMVGLVRKEDNKVNTLVDELDNNEVLPKQSIATVRNTRVFPAPPTVSPAAT